MITILVFLLLAIAVVVLIRRSSKRQLDTHDWNPSTTQDDGRIKAAMIDLAGCPCIYYAPDEPAVVEGAYREALQRGRQEGFTPVMLVLDSNLLDGQLGQFDMAQPGQQVDMHAVRARRQQLMQPVEDGRSWLSSVLQQIKEDYSYREPHGFYDTEVMGQPVTDAQGITTLQSIVDTETGKTYPLLLAQVPVQEPWQVLAWFPLGNWNACPEPWHHVSVARYWHETYGAVPAMITADELEFIVPRPVDGQDSLALAQEQYAYCQDIVNQGIGTIQAHADALRKSTVWYFWWD